MYVWTFLHWCDYRFDCYPWKAKSILCIKIMKNRLTAVVLVCAMTALTGCSSGLTESEVDKKIESAIKENNKQLSDNILSDLDSHIQAKLDEQDKLTDDEKETLKMEIMQSVDEKLSSASANNTVPVNNTSPQTKVVEKQERIVESPINKYYTNITNIEHSTSEPEKVIDGTPIPIEKGEFTTCTLSGHTTYTIETITASIYNHDSEPYREIKYPYEIHVSITGTYRNYEQSDSQYPTIDSVLILQPYGTSLGMWNEVLNEDNHTFTANYQTTLNLVPDKILLK